MADKYRGSYVGKSRDNPRRNDRYEGQRNSQKYDSYSGYGEDRSSYRGYDAQKPYARPDYSFDQKRDPAQYQYEREFDSREPYRHDRPPREYGAKPDYPPKHDYAPKPEYGGKPDYGHDRYEPRYDKMDRTDRHAPGTKDIINNSIFLSNLPRDISINEISNLFGSIGVIQTDKRTGLFKIKLFYNPDGTPKGEASIYYQDAQAADAAIKWFNLTEIRGQKINVQIAERTYSTRFINEQASRETYEPRDSRPPRDMRDFPPREPRDYPPRESRDFPPREPRDFPPRESRDYPPRDNSRGRGRRNFQSREQRSDREESDSRSKKPSFVQPGDWLCTSCKNNNFAWRTSCNRCQAAKPADAEKAGPSSQYGAEKHRSPQPVRGGAGAGGQYGGYERSYPYNG